MKKGMVPTMAKGFVSHEVWQKKKPSRECKQLQQTDASLINCADFTPKIHGPIRISRNPQNSPVSLIPQDAGLVGGSLSKKKKKKEKWSKSVVYCLWGIWGNKKEIFRSHWTASTTLNVADLWSSILTVTDVSSWNIFFPPGLKGKN